MVMRSYVLFGGTVPLSYFLFGGTVPPNTFLQSVKHEHSVLTQQNRELAIQAFLKPMLKVFEN